MKKQKKFKEKRSISLKKLLGAYLTLILLIMVVAWSWGTNQILGELVVFLLIVGFLVVSVIFATKSEHKMIILFTTAVFLLAILTFIMFVNVEK